MIEDWMAAGLGREVKISLSSHPARIGQFVVILWTDLGEKRKCAMGEAPELGDAFIEARDKLKRIP